MELTKNTVNAKPEDAIANTLKRIDPEYICAHFGKWHVDYTPKELGYDHDDGCNKNRQSTDPNDPKFIFSLTKKATEFIETQAKAERPFFLQVSYYADHMKYAALAETVHKYKTLYPDKATQYQNDPLWAAMNENLDTGVGLVLDKLNELGIAGNTYVIYTADNGYEDKYDFGKPVDQRGYYKAYPQRSHKYTVSEGGIRVPFIIRGPGVPAKTFSSTPVVGTDIFVTIMDIVGGLNELPNKVEGGSLLPQLQGNGKEPVVRENPFIVFKYTKDRVPHDIAIVKGDYKLIKDIDAGKMFLFNLKDDIGETRNLMEQKLELANKMYDEMTMYFKSCGWDESMISNAQNKTNEKGKTWGQQIKMLREKYKGQN